MLGYARTAGGPALRALTFTQRAAILKSLARHLSAHLDELATLSARTAIRRALVLATLADAVTDAVSAKLAATVVGHPADPATTMGPLASLAQCAEVREAVSKLAAGAHVVPGDPHAVTVHGADAERGAFASPVLLRCDDTSATAPHVVEAFGPVITVIPYQGVDAAVSLAARGTAASQAQSSPAILA
jgi:oxepin-CoA hydrolase/3-oxo-5,6-dehydrosuberyl-CoA semialdehyde dehydrogenase